METDMSSVHLKPLVISLNETFGSLVVQGPGIEVEFRDGKIHVRSGEIASTPTQQALGNSASPAALKVGDAVAEGPNKGWIYCETKKGDAFLVAPKDSGVMQWREAMNYAARENSELPNREQLDAMYEARDTGALKGTFNVTGSNPAGWYWSATQYFTSNAWCQRFSDGNQGNVSKDDRSSVRFVRRCSII
jgi:hypothetical protein